MSDDFGHFEKVFSGVHQQMSDVAMNIVADDAQPDAKRGAAAHAMEVLHGADRSEQALHLHARSWCVEDLEALGSRVADLAGNDSREGLSRELEAFVEAIKLPKYSDIEEPDDTIADAAPLAGDPTINESSGGDITVNERKVL
jgi:hypothetical protein